MPKIFLTLIPLVARASELRQRRRRHKLPRRPRHRWHSRRRNRRPLRLRAAICLGRDKGSLLAAPQRRRGAGFYYLDMSNAGLLSRLKINNKVGGEFFYNLGITPAMHPTFDAQAVSSARPRQQTAVILGAKVEVNF